jgi:Na+-transporting methylmalonyl-CoA/oxaloacetate decarboxylase gamma subunit
MNSMIFNSISFDLSFIDDNAVTTAVVGYCVVFTALVVLFYLFSLVPKLININIKNKLRKQGKEECIDRVDEEITGDVSAAISTAIYLYFNEQHDEESGIVTVKRIDKRYSPWSSKIYNVTNRLNSR